MTRRGLARVALVATLAVGIGLATGCTGVRVREFAREVYEPPPVPDPPSQRFAHPPSEIRAALLAVVAARGARVEERDPEAGALRIAMPWSNASEAAASVDLGRIRRVVTRTERHYRSWSPLDFDCNACVVRNGRVVDQRTELLLDELIELDPADYRLDARITALVEAAPGGSWLQLSLDVVPAPREPPELQAGSRGVLEARLLDAVSAHLDPGAGELR